jgi:hypothetical protein
MAREVVVSRDWTAGRWKSQLHMRLSASGVDGPVSHGEGKFHVLASGWMCEGFLSVAILTASFMTRCWRDAGEILLVLLALLADLHDVTSHLGLALGLTNLASLVAGPRYWV